MVEVKHLNMNINNPEMISGSHISKSVLQISICNCVFSPNIGPWMNRGRREYLSCIKTKQKAQMKFHKKKHSVTKQNLVRKVLNKVKVP